ncbi:MAG: hypothetical protein ACERKJ_11595, partial [Candidatus Dadabacteria bacterium]
CPKHPNHTQHAIDLWQAAKFTLFQYYAPTMASPSPAFIPPLDSIVSELQRWIKFNLVKGCKNMLPYNYRRFYHRF